MGGDREGDDGADRDERQRLVLRLWIGSVLASSAAVAILIVTVGGEIEALLSLNAERAYGDRMPRSPPPCS